ncbi:MAG TPA: hypothetical protein VE197_04050, partial [Mycobacterium sp.]|nr:hypothetical protein [Mycobacterium sp.]
MAVDHGGRAFSGTQSAGSWLPEKLPPGCDADSFGGAHLGGCQHQTETAYVDGLVSPSSANEPWCNVDPAAYADGVRCPTTEPSEPAAGSGQVAGATWQPVLANDG